MLLYTYLHVYVWDADITVIRAAARILPRVCRHDPALRAARKSYYRDVLKAHRDQQQLVARFRR